LERRSFLLGASAGLAVGASGGLLADNLSQDRPATAGKAPAVVSGGEIGTTWKIQTSWPAGVGLDIFTNWCHSIVEKTSGELAFQPYGAKELVGEFRLFDAVENGTLDAMNPFTLYWSGRLPAAVFLCSYPLGPRYPHEWDVFFYGLGGLELAREAFAKFNMYYVGPIQHGPNLIHSTVPIRSIDDFKGRKMRLPGGMVDEVFQAAGASSTMLPGSKIFDALRDGLIDVADYVGPAVNYELGFHKVTKYISMGPPGYPSIYQAVDLMDLTVGMKQWNALSSKMKQFVETELHAYSDLHHAAIQAADAKAWPKFEAAGTIITRLRA
jgi:TRAP-type mannitol/chloroaromatic compound transport system substrate-binding protein